MNMTMKRWKESHSRNVSTTKTSLVCPTVFCFKGYATSLRTSRLPLQLGRTFWIHFIQLSHTTPYAFQHNPKKYLLPHRYESLQDPIHESCQLKLLLFLFLHKNKSPTSKLTMATSTLYSHYLLPDSR